MAKRLSPFGNIMNLLDIGISDLTDYLYVDKTTVSKWRTGARRLSKRSPHLDKIADLMMAKNEQMETHPLKALYEKEVPGDLVTTIKLRTFLVENLCAAPDNSRLHAFGIPSSALRASLSEYANYVGITGRKKAVEHLLEVAEKMPLPYTVKIMEIEQMDWLCRDMAFLKNMMDRLKHLALQGAHVELAFSTMSDNAAFRTFIMLLEEMRYLKTVHLYLINTERLKGLIPHLYSLPDLCVAVGYDSMEPSVPIHTNLFTDYLNTHKYALFFDQVVSKFGLPISTTNFDEQENEAFEYIERAIPLKQDTYFFGDYPSVVTMSEDLYLEILNDNQLSNAEYERCLHYYHTFRRCIVEVPAGFFGSFYWNAQALEGALSYESLIEYELTALTNRHITKTKEQFQRHLLDAADFLSQHESLRAVLRQGGYSRLGSLSWIKMNSWQLSMNTRSGNNEHRVSFVQDASLIKVAEKICEESFRVYPISPDLKSHAIKTITALGQQV